MIKKCPDCKSTDVTEYTPGMFGDSRHRCNSCGAISSTDDFVEPTVFDQITASPEVLAPNFVVEVITEYLTAKFVTGYRSTIIPGKVWELKEEAHSATLEKLKEVKENE